MLNWPLREKIERNLNANAFWAAHGYWWTNVARHIWSTKWALTWQEVCINSICILNMNYGNWLFTSIYTFYLRIFKFGTCNYGEIGETRSFFRQKKAVIEYLLKQFAEYKKYTHRERETHPSRCNRNVVCIRSICIALSSVRKPAALILHTFTLKNKPPEIVFSLHKIINLVKNYPYFTCSVRLS